ncbi:class I SAM-dependent DNA methyltransferase [Singulisphaera sp. PoT]|uniref:class I SAM-dependent DNA methyltransferase n=1 Tax=Singulisphaera sp. PoT TaxID=3411797 RepID=UPI003BF53612
MQAGLMDPNQLIDMNETVERLERFVGYARTLKGDEKGEAQVFCDRLFQAFGHEGYKEAGATLEFRVKAQGGRTKFADLLWRPRLLLEMKKRGEKLQRHYTQAFEYWLQLVPERPKYVVLSNFDEFWIYDFDSQLNDPVDTVPLGDLTERYTAFNFLFPVEKKPRFGNDRVAVTRTAAAKVAHVFNSLVARGEDRERAQRFILQSVVAMFSEDADLLPRGLFSELLDECKAGASSYDLLGSLFRQMNNPTSARGGRFKDVRYFNGGVFETVDPVELTRDEIDSLVSAATENWSKVQPPIFGTLFQSSMDKDERHAYGAHFTSEADIQKVVLPTIVRPWRERIERSSTLKELQALREELLNFHVLDPACGSGNFLYVAFRELKHLEFDLMAKIHANFGERARKTVGTRSLVSTKQLFGIDKVPFAVELAKVTLMLAKELAGDEGRSWLDAAQFDLPLEFDSPLPLDNLDENIRCDDSLFCDWPRADAIIGNPPYLDARKITLEHGQDYVRKLRKAYSEVPGRADFCVYWFRKTHDQLKQHCHAGLVGTNTIRQNYSREGGLDYVVKNGGTITEAVSTQVWSGEAVVHVSIVNWIKGEQKGLKKLYTQKGDSKESPWIVEEVERIPSSLTSSLDVTTAVPLRCNQIPKPCFEGQQPGHDGFRLTQSEAIELSRKEPKAEQVLHPYLNGTELLSSAYKDSSRYIIDFEEMDILQASNYKHTFELVKSKVLSDWQANAEKEREKTGSETGEHQNRLQRWWRLKRRRQEMLRAFEPIPRYIACVRHTKRPIFEFIDVKIRPDSSLTVFSFPDDYSFGILQSGVHWAWFVARCSTIKGDFRYTSDTVFDTFPWPQAPTLTQVSRVAEAAVGLRQLRTRVMAENGWNLRELYRTLEMPGQNPLKTAQDALDAAVRAAYGMKAKAEPLGFLLALNGELADREASMKPVIGPGLPAAAKGPSEFITDDCVRVVKGS